MWWAVLLAVALAALLYLYKINASMRSVPAEIAQLSPHRWTKEEIKETYERLKKQPLDFDKLLPPRLDRRYVVVGGSGETPHLISLHLTSPHLISLLIPHPHNRPLYILTKPRPRRRRHRPRPAGAGPAGREHPHRGHCSPAPA